ncbi:MAG: C40 family peptidase [Candidatus Yonathbacteria bacterium]|nr:C40 family peptidase [Candidatus Yonathbacteria bacterium]
MLTIFVYPTRERIITAEGHTMTVRPVHIVHKGVEQSLRDCLDIGVIDDVELIFVWKGEERPFEITPHLRKHIAHVLSTHHAKPDMSFGCYAFVNMVAGLPQHTTIDMFEHWDAHGFSRPHIGDFVFFLDTKKRLFRHAAIYIGYGLYISIYGAGGVFEVSSFKDMRRDFDIKVRDIIIAKPEQKKP